MKIGKKDRIKEGYSKNWQVFDYPMSSRVIGIAFQKLDGRAPEKGSFKNKVCKEIFYIINGKGKLFAKGKEHSLSKEDIYVAEAGTQHYLFGENLEFITITLPNWYPEQCEIIKN